MTNDKNQDFTNPGAEEPTLSGPGGGLPLAKGAQKFASKIDKLQELVSDLSPADRERMAQMGMVVPDADVRDALAGIYTWGVRCTECNKVGLYFIGDKWRDGQGGTVSEPPGLPHNRIAWTQTAVQSQFIDRNVPRCQHCRVDLPLNPDLSFNRARGRIVRVKSFEASRDKSFSRQEVQALQSRVNKGLAENPEAGAQGYSANYNTRDIPVSQQIEAGRPGAMRDIEHIAAVAGLNEFAETLPKKG